MLKLCRSERIFIIIKITRLLWEEGEKERGGKREERRVEKWYYNGEEGRQQKEMAV